MCIRDRMAVSASIIFIFIKVAPEILVEDLKSRILEHAVRVYGIRGAIVVEVGKRRLPGSRKPCHDLEVRILMSIAIAWAR